MSDTPAPRDPSVTCPSCLNDYSRYDNPDEYFRVLRVLAVPSTPAEPAQQPTRTIAPTWEEICHWIRAGAPGRALEAAEAAMHSVPDVGQAEATIRERLNSDPAFTVRVFGMLGSAIAEFEKRRCIEPGSTIGPMSVSERDALAAVVLNTIFATTL